MIYEITTVQVKKNVNMVEKRLVKDISNAKGVESLALENEGEHGGSGSQVSAWLTVRPSSQNL